MRRSPLRVALHVTSRGNLFIRDLATLVAAALRDAGVDAVVEVDQPVGRDAEVLDIVVGPQEYFGLLTGLSEDARLEMASRCALLTTEHPGTPWFDQVLPLAMVSPLVLDINPGAVQALQTSGVSAVLAPLGYHPSLDLWGGVDGGRDIDVAFLGGATARRLEHLAGCADVLATTECRLHFHDPLVPADRSDDGYLAQAEKWQLLRRTKVLVNLHRDAGRSFEWPRAIEAISNGALILTEPSTGSAPLEPFEHFIAAEPELHRAHLTALLTDDVTRQRVASAAYDLLRTEHRLVDLLRRQAIPALDDLASRLDRPARTSVVAFDRLPPARPGRLGALPAPIDEAHRLRATLKQSLLAQVDLRRRIDRLDATIRGVGEDDIEELRTASWDDIAEPAEVTVVIPLYNYATTLEAALASVAAAEDVRAEVVVVDDHSTDSSVEVLRQSIERHPELPILGLLRQTNRGPSAARNAGFEAARTDRCFLLDADNLLLPRGLRLLIDAMDAHDADVAYGILEVFEGRQGLASAMPWRVESLVTRPYVDAMSLIRTAAWEKVGGFSVDDSVLYGLEDYVFWLALAAQGAPVTWVPQLVGRYRDHGASRTSIASLDPHTPLNVLRRMYPTLPWPGA